MNGYRKLLIAWEAPDTYGTAPSSADSYQIVPFVSSSLNSEQGLIESQVLGQDRDPIIFQDVTRVDRDIVLPVDLNNIGYWLKALFGDPTTTSNTTKKTHTFVSGETTVPSMTLEVGYPDVSKFFLFSGVRANNIAFNFQSSGEAQATINVIGQEESSSSSTKQGTPTAPHAYQRFSQLQGSIKKGSDLLANVTDGSLTYSNNLERIETIRSDGKIEVDLGMASLRGSITVRYAHETAVASGGTRVALTLAYTIDADNLLEITAHEVYLQKPKSRIDSPSGIEVSYDFQGAKDTTVGHMLTATLKNTIGSY